jgi:hypothetical protein
VSTGVQRALTLYVAELKSLPTSPPGRRWRTPLASASRSKM